MTTHEEVLALFDRIAEEGTTWRNRDHDVATVRAHITAQQQRIEALEAQRDEALQMVSRMANDTRPLVRDADDFLARIENDEALNEASRAQETGQHD